VLLALAGCKGLGHADAPAPVVRGPVPSRTQEPIKLTFLALRPRRATVEPVGATSILVQEAYSNLYQNGLDPNHRVVLDGEISRTSVAMRRSVGPGTDLEIEAAVVFATAGFLDAIIEGYHETFGFPSEGREERPRNSYTMEVDTNGVRAYELEGDEAGFADLPIVLTHALVEESGRAPAVSVRAGVELPTGSESKGFGNGGIDYGGGILAEKSFGRWTTTAAVDYVVPADSASFERADVSAHDNLDLQVGVEYRWNDSLSLLLGAVLESPVTRDIPRNEIDEEILSIDVGCIFDLGTRSRLLLGFEEDAIASSGPDLTLFAGWSLSL
jgi:hypothetical protein